MRSSLLLVLPFLAASCGDGDNSAPAGTGGEAGEDGGAPGTAGTGGRSDGGAVGSGGGAAGSGGSAAGSGGSAGGDPECDAGTAGAACAPCNEGTYCAGGDQSAVDCNDAGGFDHDGDPATPCEAIGDCAPGSYVEADFTPTSDRVCSPCPSAKFSDETNAVTCKPIPHLYSSLTSTTHNVCGIRLDDSKAECWGADEHDKSSDIPDHAFSSIHPSTANTCGVVAATGEALCWGTDEGGQVSDVPEGVLTSITGEGPKSGTASFLCGLDGDGLPVCWGGTAPTPPEGVAFKQIRAFASDSYVCGIRASDDHVQCWGDSGHGQAEPPIDLVAREIVVGELNACAVRHDPGATDDGTAVCWGHYAGLASRAPTEAVSHIDLSGNRACALRDADGTVVCWGAVSAEQSLPDGAFVDLVVSGATVCGLRASGEVECEGSGSYFQYLPSLPAEFDSYAVSREMVCGMSEEATECWGDDGYGLLSHFPDEVFSRLSFAHNAGCGVRRDDSKISCWPDLNIGVVTEIPNIEAFEIGVGKNSGCALSSSTQAPVCWGASILEDEAPDAAMTAIALSDGMSGAAACGILAGDGKVHCWGGSSASFVNEMPDLEIERLATDSYTMCGLQTNGAPTCWGESNDLEAVPAVTLVNLAMGPWAACGLQASGEPVCWGSPWTTETPEVALDRIFFVANGFACGRSRESGGTICWGERHLL